MAHSLTAADTKQRFVSVEAGWQRFVDYLHARNAAYIDSGHRKEMLTHRDYIDDVLNDRDTHRDKSKMSSLEAFGEYDDVISAFEKFCVEERLPTS
jgi:hypothetical protein